MEKNTWHLGVCLFCLWAEESRFQPQKVVSLFLKSKKWGHNLVRVKSALKKARTSLQARFSDYIHPEFPFLWI